ncbi:unnamed protein product [Amaranthus hypochondriacus]
MGGRKTVWMPSSIVKMVQEGSTMDDLTKLLHNPNISSEVGAGQEAITSKLAADQQLPVTESVPNDTKSAEVQQEGDEGGWTPVAPNKIARRHHHKGASNTVEVIGEAETAACDDRDNLVRNELLVAEKEIDRDGNPLIPSLQ